MRWLTKSVLALSAALLPGLAAGLAAADDVTVTLDLEFDSGRGSAGTWQLFARIDDTGVGADGQFGLSAVRALIDGIDFGVDGDAITLASGIGAIEQILDSQGNFVRSPAAQLVDGTIDLIYGQDLSESETFPGSGVFNTVVPFVGVGGDTLIASGTFSAGADPDFGQDDSASPPLSTSALFLNTSVAPFGPSSLADNVFTLVTDNILEGDYNGDGTVDAADYTVWRDNLGQSNEALMGNGTNDPSGNVVAADYDLWRDNFGQTSAASIAVTAVPEPAALLTLLFGSLAVAARRSR